MTCCEANAFLAGVIEGFYGQPWSQAERFELFEWMSQWGLNTYLYAPKDDLKHRACWRERYTPTEAASLGELIRACNERDLRFIYALSPGLDIRYKDGAELVLLRERFDQLLALGCQHFALLFDDIPDRMRAEDREWFGSFASAQCHVANALFKWVRERSPAARFLICPTPYCGRMAERKLGGEGYLETVGRELLLEIDVFWTGPEIISREITVSHAREIGRLLRRQPLIWDNLYANDYDGRRFFCGPYAGRPLELRQDVSGLLVNPNNEFPLNFVPLRTLAEFVRCPAKKDWGVRQAYLSALREWLPRFNTLGQPAAFDELVLLCDAYYLPHEDGPEAEALYRRAWRLLAAGARPALSARDETHSQADMAVRAPADASVGESAILFRQQAIRLRDFCTRLAALDDRPLFYALSRRIWELREELDLLERYVEFKSRPGNEDAAFASDFHLPGTYRGGLVARLQRLLTQRSDGSFHPVQANDPARNPENDPT